MAHVADGRRHPGPELLLLHHEADEFLRRLRVLRVLEDHLVEEQVELGRHAHRADRKVRVLDVLRHLLQLRVRRRLRRVVDRDPVGGDADLVVEERLVVVRVEPRQRPGHERRVELLRVLERLERFRAVDHDLVLLVDELAAERPEQPVRPGLVAGRVPEREAARRALLLQRLHHLEEAVDVARELVEARRLDLAFAVDDRVAGAAQRDADPLVLVLQVLLADRIPAAVLLAEIVRRRRSRRPAFPDRGWRRRWSTG